MAQDTTPVTCPECGRPFAGERALAVHFTKKHGDAVRSPHQFAPPQRQASDAPRILAGTVVLLESGAEARVTDDQGEKVRVFCDGKIDTIPREDIVDIVLDRQSRSIAYAGAYACQ